VKMSALLELYLDQFLVFTLILARISALMMTAPIYGATYIPVQIRALLAVGLSVLVAPLHWHTPIEYPGNVLNFLVIVAGEALIGLVLGLGLFILFAGVQIAGEIAGQMSGMRLGNLFDASMNTDVPIFAKLLNLVALSVFVLIGGHRQVMDALLDTFRFVPPGSGGLSGGIVQTLTDVVAGSFMLGIRAGAPIMVALLMSILVMGLISRTLPQLNILAAGFSLNAIIMLAALSLSLGSIAWIFQEQVEPTIEALRQVLQEGARG